MRRDLAFGAFVIASLCLSCCHTHQSLKQLLDETFQPKTLETTESPSKRFRDAVKTYIFPAKTTYASTEETDDESCECTPYYLCDDKKMKTNDGDLLKYKIDMNLRAAGCPLLRPCCKKVLETSNIPRAVASSNRCGVRNPKGIGFEITNQTSHQAQEAEFPWTVAVLKRKSNQFEYKCGGSLIHPRVVMTTAHCLHLQRDLDTWLIRAGDWYAVTTDEFFPHQDHDVEHVIRHENFFREYLLNDIALLVLKTPATIEPNVNTICLPPKNHNFDGDSCFASGWGAKTYENLQMESIMKAIELPIVPHQQCQQKLRDVRNPNFELHESFICAGGERGSDTCVGDGGSPLVCPIPNTVNQYYQSGIVAWGIGCNGDIPAAYVNVVYLRDWIDSKMIENGFDTASYTHTN